MDVSIIGKRTIVTGAGSGIGLAIVIKFLESGAAGVVAVDRSKELSQVFADYVEKYGERLLLIEGDVAEESTAREFTAAAMARLGGIDVLVNNAAVSVVKSLHEHTPQEWDSVMNTNVKAIYLAARHVMPVMIAQRSGVVLNAGSISGEIGIPGQGAYGPSKGAVHLMTRQMAIEYAPFGIRVNAICCGTVDTPMLKSAAEASGDPEAFLAKLRGGHPIGRIATPEEVAEFYLYVASEHASFFTGSLVMMDGGFTAR